ncbi:MAG TPA: arginine--tRNA ligase [Solirubrobacteraceae bacterium]|nr:arginine--tRNA ligase [Solirubrobacteraceae bacterium]
MNPIERLRAAVEDAAGALRADDASAPGSAPTLERSRKPEFGDYSTNAAMLLAPVLREPPRDVAERLAGELRERLAGGLARAEVAGPGFLNLFLADSWHREALADVLAAAAQWGGGGVPQPERVLIEFVSANPTGPLTAAGGRHAAYGDSLARLLEFRGDSVEREYYVNDFGSQVRRLGESIAARARGEEPPEGGYQGDYVRELAEQIPEASPSDADPDALAGRGVELMLERIERSLHAFRVDFDRWFSERSLQDGSPSPVARALRELEASGELYESEGALWLRTSARGDDKNRVLRRSDGEYTYFAADIAYHLDKRARGFDRAINIWGADHHGYVGRIKAAWQALGSRPEALEVLIMQFVNVIERGERASMSKRRGDFVTLDELVAEIGVDAARFFMLQRSHDTTVDLDLDLARDQSNENPVYYVQYAHARICSVLERAGDDRVKVARAEAAGGWAGAEPLHPSERALVQRLLAFPAEVEEAAGRRAPHRVAAYVLELAQEFTAFYRDCRVVDPEPAALESFRLSLSVAARDTIARALDLLGVSAPRAM